MGSEEDPKDGNAVAGAVFGAVFIYIVRISCAIQPADPTNMHAGLLRVLWFPGLPSPAREPSWRDNSVMSEIYGG
jgi:hypothetical protein